MMRESEIEDLARVKKESYALAISDAIKGCKEVYGKGGFVTDDGMTTLENIIQALSSLTGKEK
jgi:hypothetical protein